MKVAVKGKTSALESKQNPSGDELEEIDDSFEQVMKTIQENIKPALVGVELYNDVEINRILEDVMNNRCNNDSEINLLSVINKQNKFNIDKENSITHNDELVKTDTTEVEDIPKNDEHRNGFVHLDILAVSMAIAKSASVLQESQLFNNLYFATTKEEPDFLSLPMPFMCVLRCDKKTSGKLYMFKDVMIAFKNTISSFQALKQLTNIYEQLESNTRQKPTANMTADNGALTPSIDRPEQSLDLLRDAITTAGYSYEDDVIVAIRICSQDIYDKDKQKYEICLNTLKTSEEIMNVYFDLCQRYPEIKILVDPFISQDAQSYSQLSERLKGNCFILSQDSFAKHATEEAIKEGLVCGKVMELQDVSTVAQFMQQSRFFAEFSKLIFVTTNDLSVLDDFMVDLAVAAQAHCVIFGAPSRSCNIQIYNRLLEIEKLLSEANILVEKRPQFA
ncbi:enolase 2-like isoform X2 [Xenia sp. Carnegie-2017]|nr:enolase 2-like isoform X2 [Xenia sp. Carnegie-2017]